jgi:O-antigen ligase
LTVRHASGAEDRALPSADPLSSAGYALILLAVPLLTCNALRAGETLSYGDIPLALAGLLLFAAWLGRGHPSGVVPLGLPVGAFLLLTTGLVAVVVTGDAASIAPTLRFAVTLGVMPLLIMLAAPTPRRVQRLVDVWLLAAGLNAALGALDLLGLTAVGASVTGVDFAGFTDRPTGLTLHPNHLGLVAAMAFPVAVARLGLGGFRGLGAIILVPLLMVGVVESGSRGALLAAVAGVVLLFALGVTTRRSRTTLLLVAAPIATFVLIVAVLGNNELTGSVAFDRLSGGSGAVQSDAQRRVLLEDSLGEAVANPLVGTGFSDVRTAHNIYLQLLQAGGLLALAGFLAFAVSVVRRARWLAMRGRGLPPSLMSLAAGSGASVCVWLLFGMVGNAVFDRYLYLPVGVVLALGLVQARCAAVVRPTTPPPPGRAQPSARAGRRGSTPGRRSADLVPGGRR